MTISSTSQPMTGKSTTGSQVCLRNSFVYEKQLLFRSLSRSSVGLTFLCFAGKTETPVEYDTEVMNMLKEHAKNEEKEERFVQPDLYAKY
jgi:hypothetical protein